MNTPEIPRQPRRLGRRGRRCALRRLAAALAAEEARREAAAEAEAYRIAEENEILMAYARKCLAAKGVERPDISMLQRYVNELYYNNPYEAEQVLNGE